MRISLYSSSLPTFIVRQSLLGVLPGFVIRGHNLNNIIYTVDTDDGRHRKKIAGPPRQCGKGKLKGLFCFSPYTRPKGHDARRLLRAVV